MCYKFRLNQLFVHSLLDSLKYESSNIANAICYLTYRLEARSSVFMSVNVQILIILLFGTTIRLMHSFATDVYLGYEGLEINPDSFVMSIELSLQTLKSLIEVSVASKITHVNWFYQNKK